MDWNRYSSLFARMSAGLMILLSLGLFQAQAGPPRFKRVVIVVLENTDFSKAISQPFLTDLANRGALLTQLAATTHPSQPNYIALIAGSTLGVSSAHRSVSALGAGVSAVPGGVGALDGHGGALGAAGLARF